MVCYVNVNNAILQHSTRYYSGLTDLGCYFLTCFTGLLLLHHLSSSGGSIFDPRSIMLCVYRRATMTPINRCPPRWCTSGAWWTASWSLTWRRPCRSLGPSGNNSTCTLALTTGVWDDSCLIQISILGVELNVLPT